MSASRYLPSLIVIIVAGILYPAIAASDLRTIVFEAQKIEGKIRRPQLVLIKADQRPSFVPMAIQSFGKNSSFLDFVDKTVFENVPYRKPFQISGTAIADIQP